MPDIITADDVVRAGACYEGTMSRVYDLSKKHRIAAAMSAASIRALVPVDERKYVDRASQTDDDGDGGYGGYGYGDGGDGYGDSGCGYSGGDGYGDSGCGYSGGDGYGDGGDGGYGNGYGDGDGGANV